MIGGVGVLLLLLFWVYQGHVVQEQEVISLRHKVAGLDLRIQQMSVYPNIVLKDLKDQLLKFEHELRFWGDLHNRKVTMSFVHEEDPILSNQKSMIIGFNQINNFHDMYQSMQFLDEIKNKFQIEFKKIESDGNSMTCEINLYGKGKSV